MTSSRRTLVIALGASLGPWVVPTKGVAAPAPSEGTTSRVPSLAVWIEETVPEGERVRGWVEDRAARVLNEHQPLEPQDLIRVGVRGGPYDYRIFIALVRDKRLLPGQPPMLVCECGSTEMLERVGEAIAAGAERLAQVARAERAAKAAAEAADAERKPAPPPPPVEADERRRRLGPLGYVGIGATTLGVGFFAAGIPLLVRPVQTRGEPGGIIEHRLTRPPGVGLSVAGGLTLATGVSLLVLDLVRHRKRKGAALSVIMIGPAGVGSSFTHRF